MCGKGNVGLRRVWVSISHQWDIANIRWLSYVSTEKKVEVIQAQALGSVKRLETIVLLWRYINKIELN